MRFNLGQLFNVFSNRPEGSAKAQKSLTVEFKNRILLVCRDTFYPPEFWEDMHQRLRYLHGRTSLAGFPSEPIRDAVTFLWQCSDKHFLDFVELIFQPHSQSQSASELVSAVNKFLQIDNLPYLLTDFVWVPVEDEPPGVMELAAYPQIIRRESEVLHNTVIEPTLTFLKSPAFALANKEFLDALADYRKGEFQDSVLKCNSSLESVMKVICDRKGWRYPGNADAETLIGLILPKTNLPPSYKTRLQVVPITRNTISSAHGAGSQPRVVEGHVASFVINSTAASILLLVEECLPA